MQEDRIQRLEGAIEALTQRVQALEQRLRDSNDAIPTGNSGATADGEALAGSEGFAPDLITEMDRDAPAQEVSAASNPLPLIGRTLLVLGGAFLLRAATESGALPQLAGAFVGFLYGLGFLVFAHRAGQDPAGRQSARFHGLASALIVFPLLWEATVQKSYLPVDAGAVLLAVAVGLALFVAWRRELQLFAWLFACAGAITGLAMAWATHHWGSLLAVTLIISWLTLLLYYARGWGFLAALGAFFADVTILLLGTLFILQSESPFLEGLTLSTILALQLLLVGSYLGSFVFRTLLKGEEIRSFEAVQTVAVLMVGVGLALVMGRSHPALLQILGWMSLLGAGLSYGVSFAFIDRQASRRRNFILYTSIALALMMVMAATLTAGGTRTWLLLAAAVFTALLAVQRRRVTLLLHATLFATAAAFSSGLLALSLDAFTGDAVQVELTGLVPLLAVLAVLALCAWLQVSAHQGTWGPLVSAPRVICLSLLVLGGSGVLAGVAETLIRRGDTIDGAWVASIRTVVLSCFAVLMAGLALRPRFREAGWLVYPVLVLGGLELVFGDFRSGRPVTMFVSLAFYGGALILSPWLIKRRRQAADSEIAGA